MAGSRVRVAGSWGCSVWGLLWVSVASGLWLRGCFGSPGERIATRSVWGCSSVGALGRHSWSASQDTTRLGGSAAPARPPRVWPTSVRHERVTPDESTCSTLRRMASGRVRPSPGAPGSTGRHSGPRKTSMPRTRLVVAQRHPQVLGGACDGATIPHVASNRTAPNRGIEAHPSMSDGVYSLMRLHDSWHARGLSVPGSDCVPTEGGALHFALPGLDCGGEVIDVPRRRG